MKMKKPTRQEFLTCISLIIPSLALAALHIIAITFGTHSTNFALNVTLTFVGLQLLLLKTALEQYCKAK